MTREEIREELLAYSVNELLAALIGIAVAMQEAREKYPVLLPAELAELFRRVDEVVEEEEAR